MKKGLLIPAVCMLGLAIGFAGCSNAGEQAVAEQRIAVVVTAAQKGEIKKEIPYVGQIMPSESVTVISKISGKVKEVSVEIGEKVNKDDVLFSIDEKDLNDQLSQLDAQIKQAEYGVKNAETSLSTVTGGQYEAQLLQQETAITSAEKQVENAKIAIDNAKIALDNAQKQYDNVSVTFNNTEILYNAGSVSKNDYDKIELSYKQAQAGVDQANNTYTQALLGLETAESSLASARNAVNLTRGSIARENTTKAQIGVGSAQSSKDVLDIQRKVLLSNLEDTSIKSPISGVVGSKSAKAGEYSTAQNPAYVVVSNIDTVNVEVKVSELLINKINIGDNVRISVRSIDRDDVVGNVFAVSSVADQSGAFPVKIRIDNADGVLKPGMFAEIGFVRDESAKSIVLPRNTVFDSEEGPYVFVNDNGVAKRSFVETGINNGKEIEIVTGLNEGDPVITKGQNFLSEGDRLEIASAEQKGE